MWSSLEEPVVRLQAQVSARALVQLPDHWKTIESLLQMLISTEMTAVIALGSLTLICILTSRESIAGAAHGSSSRRRGSSPLAPAERPADSLSGRAEA